MADVLIPDAWVCEATGMHPATLRAMVTQKLILPADSGGGRGRSRQWTREAVRHIALAAAFQPVGVAPHTSMPFIYELTEHLLRDALDATEPHRIEFFDLCFPTLMRPDAALHLGYFDRADTGPCFLPFILDPVDGAAYTREGGKMLRADDTMTRARASVLQHRWSISVNVTEILRRLQAALDTGGF